MNTSTAISTLRQIALALGAATFMFGATGAQARDSAAVTPTAVGPAWLVPRRVAARLSRFDPSGNAAGADGPPRMPH